MVMKMRNQTTLLPRTIIITMQRCRGSILSRMGDWKGRVNGFAASSAWFGATVCFSSHVEPLL